MKVKNLLLAGLAAFAMASCSNNDEVTADGGQSLVNNAKMRLTIALPQSSNTRAVTGGTEVGTVAESNINDLTVIVKIGTATIYKTYEVGELTDNTTPDFEVPAGAATVLAFVNYGKGTVTLDNYTKSVEKAEYTGLTINNSIASTEGKGNFHMYGEGNGPVVAGTQNHVIVNINRVVAKIVEKSFENQITFTPGIKTPDDKTQYPKIVLKDYSIINMGMEVSTAKDNAESLTNTQLYNAYKGLENTTCQDIFKGLVSAKLDKVQTSYCLANQTPDLAAGGGSDQTYIVYKAKITYDNDGGGITGTFYVRDGKAYNLASLQIAYPNIYKDLTDDTSIEDWFKVGVLKYENGFAYYKKPIQTINENKILRNNVYNVTVKNITGLGAPALDIPTTPTLTYLDIQIKVNQWTVQTNDITLE